MNPDDYNRLQSDYFSASVNYSRATQMAEEVDDYDGSDQIEFATEALEETNRTCNQFKIIENHILRMMDELSPNHSVYRILQDLLADVQKKIGWSTLVLQRYKNLIANSDALGSFAEGLEFKTKYGHIPEELLDRLAGLDEDALEQVLMALGGSSEESDEEERPEFEDTGEGSEEEESEEVPEEDDYEPEITVPTGEGEPIETDPAHLFGNVDREGQPEEVIAWEDPKKVEEDKPEQIAAESEDEPEEDIPETAELIEDQPKTEVFPEEMICTQCGGLFDPSKGVGKINGYYYCPVCYQKITGESNDSEETTEPVPEPAPKKRIIRKRTTKKKPAKRTTMRSTKKTTPKKEDSE